MKQRLKRILNKKGITLVELLVALVISTMLIAITATMMGPVSALLNTVKGASDMDSMCDTANDYIRASLQSASDISIYYSGSDISAAIDAKLGEYQSFAKDTTDKNSKKTVKAIAVLPNSSGDYRIYDFGTISSMPAETFNNLIENENARDSGDYFAFDEAFYNYTDYRVSFSNQTSSTTDSDGNNALSGYLRVQSQCFKETGDGTEEAASQIRSLSFKIFNSSASVSSAEAVSGEIQDSDESYASIDPDVNKGVIILYATKDWSGIFTAT